MKELKDEFGERGFCILAYPCSQFFQETPSPKSITRKCTSMGFEDEGADLMENVNVKGRNIDPVYAFLRAKTGISIKWNFYAYFLVSRTGAVEGVTGVDPKKLSARITELLDEDPKAQGG